MSKQAVPFLLTSKVVRRSDTDPAVIIEGETAEDDGCHAVTAAEGPADLTTAPPPGAADHSADLPLKNTSDCSASQLGAESGWVYEDVGDVSLFSQASEPDRDISGHSHPDGIIQNIPTGVTLTGGRDDEEDPLQTNTISALLGPGSQDGHGSRSQQLSQRRGLSNPLYDLPHPSKLRRKGCPGVKRLTVNRHRDRDMHVERHIQQLERKKAACFSTRSKVSRASKKELDETPTGLSHADDFAAFPPALPSTSVEEQREEKGEKGEVLEDDGGPVVQRLPTKPVGEEDEDRWFKSHWRSQPSQHSAGRGLEE